MTNRVLAGERHTVTDAPGTGADHRADPVLLRWASRRREFEAIQAQRDIALQLQRLADAIERLVGIVPPHASPGGR